MKGVSLERSCQVLGLCARKVWRWRKGVVGGHRSGNCRPYNALTEEEKGWVRRVCAAKELADYSLRALSFHLLEEAKVYVSHVSIGKYLNGLGVAGGRIRARRGCGGGKPDTGFAWQPNELWSWDITCLPCDLPWQHYYGYFIEDWVSRKIVAWEVSDQENSEVSIAVWDQAIQAEGLLEEPKVLWPVSLSDRGSQMKSNKTKRFFSRNGITQLFARPRTPDDNPEIESLFATMKSRPDYPGYFGALEEAREWVGKFVNWYNFEHHHRSLDYVTPDQRHRGMHEQVLQERREVIASCLEKRRMIHAREKVITA